jgi:hypothetical protein
MFPGAVVFKYRKTEGKKYRFHPFVKVERKTLHYRLPAKVSEINSYDRLEECQEEVLWASR